MTKNGKSALAHQGDQKNELSDYLNNLQVSSETKNIIKRLFYFFMPTEVQARISSSARYFEDKDVRDRARQILKDEISEQMASLGYSKKYINNFIEVSGVLKGTSPHLMEICIKMTSDLNFMDEIDDIVRSTRDDKELRDLIYAIDTDVIKNCRQETQPALFLGRDRTYCRRFQGNAHECDLRCVRPHGKHNRTSNRPNESKRIC